MLDQKTLEIINSTDEKIIDYLKKLKVAVLNIVDESILEINNLNNMSLFTLLNNFHKYQNVLLKEKESINFFSKEEIYRCFILTYNIIVYDYAFYSLRMEYLTYDNFGKQIMDISTFKNIVDHYGLVNILKKTIFTDLVNNLLDKILPPLNSNKNNLNTNNSIDKNSIHDLLFGEKNNDK